MNDSSKQGPMCSLSSRPLSEKPESENYKYIDPVHCKEIIESGKSAVIIIGADWCGDCINQKRNLAGFERALKELDIALYLFTAEGRNYDEFLSPEHKELTMRIFGTPLEETVFGSRSAKDESSVMAFRGREAYPTAFYFRDGKLQVWSIEDVSNEELLALVEKIRVHT